MTKAFLGLLGTSSKPAMEKVQQRNWVIKRTADGYVNQGRDVTGSYDLIMALESKETSVKLMKITEHRLKEMEDDLPIYLKPIAKTMQIP